MKKIAFTLYKFEELSNKAKLTAVQLHRKAFLGENLYKKAWEIVNSPVFFTECIKKNEFFANPKFNEDGNFAPFENVEFHLVDNYKFTFFGSEKLELDERHLSQTFKASFDGENVTVVPEIDDETSKVLAGSAVSAIHVYITTIYQRQRDHLISVWQTYDHIAYMLTYEMNDLWFLADGRVATENHLAFLN